MVVCQVSAVALDFDMPSRIGFSESKRNCCTLFPNGVRCFWACCRLFFCKQDLWSWTVAIPQGSMPSVITHLLHAFIFLFFIVFMAAHPPPCFPCMQEPCSYYSRVLSQHVLRLGTVDHHKGTANPWPWPDFVCCVCAWGDPWGKRWSLSI